jgi:hypothetical protein
MWNFRVEKGCESNRRTLMDVEEKKEGGGREIRRMNMIKVHCMHV